ncbi:nucleoside triphosphate pyrophosphohydrolase [Peribacillus tepidiphilus]|uniref:nucleoside triphosphate pyrophosphohydrolase n=1 Tax=Peribacillus tepidiphilus TaxID=2652445 RepID=UPI0035B53119
MNKKITVIGLGAGDINQIPLGVYKIIKKAKTCFARTKDHPVISELTAEGVTFESFDYVYEKHDSFRDVYEEIVDLLLKMAEADDILYAVPGHPMVAEMTVQLLLEKGPQKGIEIKIEGGQSFLDALFQAVKIDPIDGFQLLDGTALRRDDIAVTQHVIIGQVYDSFIASEVKLTLMEKYPDDFQVYIITAAGSNQERVVKLPLYELDRQMELSNLTSIYVPPIQKDELLYGEFFKLRQIIAELRGPNGCPWDKKQTHKSLKKYLIEEAYELIDAINEDDDEAMISELGDVLLQVMLHAQIAEDEGMFTVTDVIQSISEKMVRRHPHVFGEVHVENEQEVVSNWEKIKQAEKGGESKTTSLLAGVEKSLPALLQAYEYQKRAAKVGFDWKELWPAWEKVKEEILEFETELKEEIKDQEKLASELGDLFFALVNIARFISISPEEALHRTNMKFIRRFQYIEERVRQSGKSFEDFTLEELDAFWEEAKKKGI